MKKYRNFGNKNYRIIGEISKSNACYQTTKSGHVFFEKLIAIHSKTTNPNVFKNLVSDLAWLFTKKDLFCRLVMENKSCKFYFFYVTSK